MSGVRHNLTSRRPCVRCISTTADMKMLQVYEPRTMESLILTRKKYEALLHIENYPQTNRHDGKDSHFLLDHVYISRRSGSGLQNV